MYSQTWMKDIYRTCAGNPWFRPYFETEKFHGFPLDLSINQPLVISSYTDSDV